MFAFDSDVLIYASQIGNPLGAGVARLFDIDPSIQPKIGYGSTLLLPETLPHAIRQGNTEETAHLQTFFTRIELIALDEKIANRATALGAKYGLKAADATHLATAVEIGADGFVTNNRKDFPKTIKEIAIIYPSDL